MSTCVKVLTCAASFLAGLVYHLLTTKGIL